MADMIYTTCFSEPEGVGYNGNNVWNYFSKQEAELHVQCMFFTCEPFERTSLVSFTQCNNGPRN